MKLIGITGPTGAGKTTALSALEGLGGAVIDCDKVYHDLTVHSGPMREELKERFGDIFAADGSLDRKALGEVVFADPQALSDLNAITHKYVSMEVDRLVKRAGEEGRPAVAVDAIALFEGGLADRCDVCVAVTAPPEIRVKRIMAREGISEAYARKRMAAQHDDDWFRGRCQYLLVNDRATAEEFYADALTLFEQIINS